MADVRPLALLALLSGCCLEPIRYPRWENPPNPFPVRRIAVCPVLNGSGALLDPIAGGEALASELTGFPGSEVVWPRQWCPQPCADMDELLSRARAAGAEAVLLASVTELSPYQPPRIGLSIALYPLAPPKDPAATPVPYEDLAEAGQPAEGLPRSRRPWLAAAAAVYDAQDGRIRDRLHAWGLQRRQTDASFDWQRGLYAQDEYLRFCLNESLRTLCAEGRRLELSSRKSRNPLKKNWK